MKSDKNYLPLHTVYMQYLFINITLCILDEQPHMLCFKHL